MGFISKPKPISLIAILFILLILIILSILSKPLLRVSVSPRPP